MLLIWWYIQLISIYICVALHQSATSTCPHSTVHLFACRFVAATAAAAEFISNPIDLNWLYLLFCYTTHICSLMLFIETISYTHKLRKDTNILRTIHIIAVQKTIAVTIYQFRGCVYLSIWLHRKVFCRNFFGCLLHSTNDTLLSIRWNTYANNVGTHKSNMNNTILLHSVIRPESTNKILGASGITEIFVFFQNEMQWNVN